MGTPVNATVAAFMRATGLNQPRYAHEARRGSIVVHDSWPHYLHHVDDDGDRRHFWLAPLEFHAGVPYIARYGQVVRTYHVDDELAA